MANIFRRKKEIDEEYYEAWDELDDYGEESEESWFEDDAEAMDDVEMEEAIPEEEEYMEEDSGAAFFADTGVLPEVIFEEEYSQEEASGEEIYEEEHYQEEASREEAYFEEEYSQEGALEEEAYLGEEYSQEEVSEEEAYLEEEYSDEEYSEDEYYEDEYYEDDDEEDDEGGFFGGMSLVDKLITFGGAALVMVAIGIAGFFVMSHKETPVANDYLAVGNQIADIEIIGESGLLAVADQEQGRLQSLEDAFQAEDTNQEYNESEYSDQVSVGISLTSIEKDLKIKFINKDTGKLIGNVPFSVEVTDADGNTSMWSDDDMDGIIYKKKLTPGNYKVTAMGLEGEKYAKYDMPQATNKAEVKSEIVIQKVDVSNEIKDESQVDVSKEDTAQKGTEVEEYLEDTVTWVESTITDATYVEISKDLIEAPPVPVVTTGMFSLRRFFTGNVADKVVTVSPPDALSPELTKGTISIDKNAVVLQKTQNEIVKVTSVGGFLPERAIVYTVSSSNGAVATASVDSTGVVTITGISDGEAVITVMANYAEGGSDATMASAQISVKVADVQIQLHIIDMTVYTTMSDTINVFITNASVPESEYVIEAVSSDATVATATVADRVVTVNGLKAGVADITVTYKEGETAVSQVCKVTVVDHPMTDTQTKLVVKDTKEQLYVYDGSNYREATYADYYTATKFYVLDDKKYTGWQTLSGKVYFYDASGKKVTGEQVIQGVKYNFASDGSLVTGTGVMGIDVSKWNGNIDWRAVKNSGVSYVIIRCGYRGSTQGALIEDSKFKDNIEGAIDAGLKVGVYFFTQAIDNAEALEEASMVLELVKKYRISYPIFLDVEPSGGRADALSKEERTAVCKTFCETIEKYGYTAGIYANKTWLTSKIDASALSSYKIWLAQYASTPTYSGKYDIWQYKDTGKVSGINGNVDLNMSYLGY